MILYADMVADMFHYGHVEFIKNMFLQKKEASDKIYIGIHNDETVKSYKRQPVLTMEERIKVLSCCKYIDKIIPDAPLQISKAYIDLHEIDLIFIPSNRTEEEIKQMVAVPYELGLVRQIPYTHEITTTELIRRIREREDL